MRMLLLSLVFLAPAGLAADPVYRYTDEKGVIHYTDKPPSKDAKPVQLPPLQTFPATPVAPGPSTASVTPLPGPVLIEPMPIGTRFSLSISSPTPDQIFREIGGGMNVSVAVMPGLVRGYGLVYYVDGKARNADPTDATTFSLPDLDRGSHTVAVAMIGPDGKEVARSEPVTVHFKLPVAPPPAPPPAAP